MSPTMERREDGYPPRQYPGGTAMSAGTGTGMGTAPAENGIPMGYVGNRDGPAYPGAAHTHNAPPLATNV